MKVLLFIYLLTVTIFYPYGYMKVRGFDIIAIFSLVLFFYSIFIKKRFVINKTILILFPLVICEGVINILSLSIDSQNVLSFIRYLFIYVIPIILFSLHGENKIDLKRILWFLLIINLIYSILQILAGNGIISESSLVARNLNIFLAESHNEQFKWTSRVNGLFLNSTQYSMFLSFCLYIIYGETIKNKILFKDFIIMGMIVFSIILTQSRVALLIVIFNSGIYFIFSREKFKIMIIVVIGIILSKKYLSKYLFRILRLFDEGLNDYSANTRIYLWKNVMEGMKNHPYGTFENPVKVFKLIDSGYLTYYAQGKYFLLVPIVFFLISLYILAVKNKNYTLFFLTNYIIIGMFFFNILHNFMIIFLVVYLLNDISKYKERGSDDKCIKLHI